MSRIALTALNSTPKLAQCTAESFLGCILQAAQLGLEVNTPLGHAYLIPFEDRKRGVVICQLIVGYQGQLDLARRSGMIKAIYAYPVYEGDVFSWTLGLSPDIKHSPMADPGDKPRRMTHVYAVARLEGGEPIFTVLTHADVLRYKARSKASGSGPWISDFEAMALKTAIRRLYRWLPKSTEMALAHNVDEAPEYGKSQLGAMDEEVLKLLQSQSGLDVAGEVAATTAETPDPQTGELPLDASTAPATTPAKEQPPLTDAEALRREVAEADAADSKAARQPGED
jgi:recombination protein RecT